MPTIFLVRHGKPAAAFDRALDPGLDPVGEAQAERAAQELAKRGPLPIWTSPLARARETAAPLALRWNAEARVETRVTELPSPGDAPAGRARFVRDVMARRWSELPAALQTWREALLACLAAQPADCVVFTHFIAINAAVGAAEGDDRVAVFRPDHASITTCEVVEGALSSASRGRELQTEVR